MRIPERCRLPHWAGGWPGQAACPQGTPADPYRLRFFIFSFRRSAMNVFDVRVYAIGAQGPPPVRSPLACRWPGPVPFVHHQGAGWQLPRRGGPGRAPGPGVRPGHWRSGAVRHPAGPGHHVVPARGRLRGYEMAALAPHSRASLAEALATLTPVLTRATGHRPPARSLRAALHRHVFNPHQRNATPDPATASAVAWLDRASPQSSTLHDPRVLRRAPAPCPALGCPIRHLRQPAKASAASGRLSHYFL